MRCSSQGTASSDRHNSQLTLAILSCCAMIVPVSSLSMAAELTEDRQRARELGIVVGQYQPGPLNAITDEEIVAYSNLELEDFFLRK